MQINNQINAEITQQYGFIPPFFNAAQETPQVLANLWQQTITLYVNNPLPAVFKEKLFAYLSRYCTNPYCLTYHTCTLHSLGLTPQRILALLESPTPIAPDIEAQCQALTQLTANIATASGQLTSWPEPDSALENNLIKCSIAIFLQVDQHTNCRNTLRRLLGTENYNHLTIFLGFIKTCHIWVEAHPELSTQIDQQTQNKINLLFAAEARLAEFFDNYNEKVKSERHSQQYQLAVSTQCDHIEAALHESPGLLQQLTEHIPEVFWITDPDKNQLLYVSSMYEQIWGQSCKLLYEQPESFLNSIHVEDRDRIIAAKPQVIQGQYDEEYRVVHPDGTIRWIRDRAFPIRNQQGTVDYIVGIAENITKNKQLEEELRESENQLRLALSAVHMGIWEWQISTNKITWSDNLEALFGMEPGSFDGKYETFIACVHPQDREFVNQSVMHSVQEGTEYDIEFRVVWPDGTIRWAASKGHVFCDATGEPVRMAGVDMDITKRKQAEERLLLLESVVINTHDAVVITEAEPIEELGPQIIYVNPAFTKMTGYTLEEVVGKTPRILQGSNSDRATLDKIHTALKCWQPVCVEIINYRKDGSQFWVEISIAPVTDRTGWYTHWIAIQRDITERKQIEQENLQLLAAEQTARTQAETANRTKDEFVAIVSHELRSPLNSILGWSKLLRTRKFDAATTTRALETIERNAHLQTQLIEDLLDISRMIRGKLRINLSKVNLISVMQAAIDVVRPSADAKAIHLESIFEETTLSVSADAVRLQQIIWNLVSNAIKFTPQGGQIQIKLAQVEHQAEISVKDTGMGISDEFLPHVFDRFRQADATMTRSYGGLGLGLAIVRQLVELHDGTVYADSLGVGQGATFTVKLPLLEASRESELTPTTSDRAQLTNCLTNLQILVVDDEADAREFVTTVLSHYGSKVTAVTSPAAALEVLAQLQPDVLVSDIGMPGENGYSLIRKLKEMDARGGNIPAVALTAYARDEDREQALAVGFQIHLSKPVDPVQLATAIATLILQSRQSSLHPLVSSEVKSEE